MNAIYKNQNVIIPSENKADLFIESSLAYEDIISLAKQLCNVPIVALSSFEGERHLIKAQCGIDVQEDKLLEPFCSLTVQENKFLQIEDASKDSRFRKLPIVARAPKIRFYAGVPLIGSEGTVLGTLSVVDTKPKSLKPAEQEALERLGKIVETQMELRHSVKQLSGSVSQLQYLEQELRRQQEEYKRIVDSASELIYEVDREGRITFFNPATLRLLEFSEDEIIGRNYIELIRPDYRFTVQRFYTVQSVRRAPVSYYEVPAVSKTGKIIWLGQNVTFREKDGEALGFSVVARDITERKQVEIALLEGQEQYRTIFENAAEGIYMTDPETRRVIDANPAFARIVEYSVDELRGLSVYDLVVDSPENIDRRMENLHRLRNPIRIERTYRAKTGREVFVEAAVSVIMLHSKETLVTIIHDVTERKEAEAKLLASEQRFRELFTKIPLPAWVCDLETLKFLEVNDAAVKRYGYSRNEFLSLRITDIRSHRFESQMQIAYELFQTRQTSKTFSQHRLKNGAIIDVELTWHEIVFDGRKALFVIVRDVTELKRAQDELERSKSLAEQASVAKSEFLANMSHEIRTPMNGILGTIELLSRTPLTQEQKNYLDTIQVSGDALLKIINNILDFSRLEAGDIQAEEQELYIDPFIEELFEIVAIQAEQKGLELHYWIDEDVPNKILTDVTRLRQILLNLISNAVEFTEKGGVVVTVARGIDKSDRMGLLFSVKDTGVGIPKERIEKIFQPFTQEDSSMTRKHGGLGLGLTICARSVEILGGRIWIDSVVGEGTTVRFDIRTGNAFSTPGAPSEVDIFKGRRILFASDHEIQKSIIKRLLELWGCKVEVVTTPEELLLIVSKEMPPDCVILNAQLGEASSVNLISMIRQRQNWERTKAVLLVPHGKFDYTENSVPTVFLRKPLKHQQLLQKLNSFFANTVDGDNQKNDDPEEEIVGKEVKPLRILVAEDNVINQKLILRILKSIGYEGEVVNSGKEVVEKVQSSHYDIVFMDVQMPEMDGFEATKKIHETIPKERWPIIIAMTAHALQGDRELCLEAGMDDYMSKPLLIDDVRKCLERWSAKI